MAMISESASLRTPANIVGLLTDISDAYRNWRRARRTYAELSRLSDSELDDIGITRSMIAEIARGERV